MISQYVALAGLNSMFLSTHTRKVAVFVTYVYAESIKTISLTLAGPAAIRTGCNWAGMDEPARIERARAQE